VRSEYGNLWETHQARPHAYGHTLWSEAEGKGDTTRLREAEMISGQAEGQLLQLLVKFGGVKKGLDSGTFTGYSLLARAEVLPEDRPLVTLEREQVAAKRAAGIWAVSPRRGKIESRVGEAHELLQALASKGASFDLASWTSTSWATSLCTRPSWRQAC
jgi:predicted O-methyltransferase YrrM